MASDEKDQIIPYKKSKPAIIRDFTLTPQPAFRKVVIEVDLAFPKKQIMKELKTLVDDCAEQYRWAVLALENALAYGEPTAWVGEDGIYRQTPDVGNELVYLNISERREETSIPISWELKKEWLSEHVKGLQPKQRHKFLAQYEARKLWEIYPEMTIADMIYRDELNRCFEGQDYNEKTVRNWIKHLCPDRSPGRRPTKK
jgi:hypothetical protein